MYAFYKNDVDVRYENGRKYHQFHCDGKNCSHKVRRYLDKKDFTSTSNLRKHAVSCWGEDAVKIAMSAKNADEAREKYLKGLKLNGTITAAFERQGKEKVTYSHTAHTPMQTR